MRQFSSKKTDVKVLLLISFCLIVVFFFLSTFVPLASASVITFSNVLDDLEKDESFDVSNYSLMSYEFFSSLNSDSDTSNDVDLLSVIHIAESDKQELFVYTYQPLNNIIDIEATSIVMSVGADSTEYNKYSLQCVSKEGALKKYLVVDFVVSNDFYRYYNIVEIERPFDILFDEAINNETITEYKAHNVGQTWCCYYLNDNLVYEMTYLEVLEITPTLTDYIYCPDGITWGSLVGVNTACYSHYIAFNLDNYEADRIIDATMTFMSRAYRQVTTEEFILGIHSNTHVQTLYPEGMDFVENVIELSAMDVVSHTGEGLFAKSYSWNRIMTALDFVQNFERQGGELKNTTKEILLESQFVFVFTETASTKYSSDTWSDTNPPFLMSSVLSDEGVEIEQVDIIRIKFESKGQIYNLGVVSDTTTSDDVPGGVMPDTELPDFEGQLDEVMTNLVTMILSVIIGIVVLVLFFACIYFLLKAIFKK